MKIILTVLIMALVLSCVADENEDDHENEYEYGEQLGTAPSGVKENSGMAYSEDLNRLYYINDSGNGKYLFISSMEGELIEKVKVNGVDNDDWEGLAYSPCGVDTDTNCIYIGDIGDNTASERYHHIYVVEEKEDYKGSTSILRDIKYFYEGNVKTNAESLAVHPTTGDIYIASKNYDGDPTVIYRILNEDFVDSTNVTVEAKRVGSIDYRKLSPDVDEEHTWTGAMSISPSGKKFILITVQSEQVWEFFLDFSTFETFEASDLVDNFQIIPVDYLGQEESVEYYSEDQFVYSTEGDNAPIVSVSIP